MSDPNESGISVLLVEDDPESGIAMKDMLERRSVTVRLLLSPAQAIPLLRASTFDILVTDIRLGPATGIDLLQQVRDRDPEFPVILITGYDDINSAIEAVRLGAQNYILKPLDAIEDLLLPIQRAVSNHRMRTRTRILEESERRLGHMLASTTDFVFMFDPEGRFIFCNRRADSPDLWRPPGEFLGKRHPDVMPPEVGRQFMKAFAQVQAGETGEYDYSLEIAGQRRHFSAKLTPMMERGRFAGAMAIVRDITERVALDQELRTRNDAIEAAAHAIAFADLDAKLIHVNRTFLDIWGYSDVQEVLGRSLLEFWATPPASTELAKTLSGDGQWAGELAGQRRNGRPFFVRGSANVVKDGAGRAMCIVGCFEDVTSEKRAQDDLAAYQQKLRQLTEELTLAEERERKRIAMGLHESVAQLLSLARARLSVMPESAQEMGEPQMQVLTDISDWLGKALTETKTLAFDLYPPSLYSEGLEFALRDLAERMSEQWKARISIEDDGGRMPLSENVTILLYRATGELILNTCKHSKARRVTLAMAHEHGQIRITVSDDGQGFDTRLTSRAGLGLFTISERLRSVGGTFEIQSTPGRGTTATLSAPPGEGKRTRQGRRKTDIYRQPEAP